MDIQEKKGIIKEVELVENAENALRLVVETAEIVDISDLANIEDVTDFVLSNKIYLTEEIDRKKSIKLI